MSAPRHSDPRQAAAAPGQGQKDAPRVAIVGAGAAGLYAALLLQSYGYLVTVYEATGRVGGRIFTHHFTAEPEQYFEAGAMRIPPVKAQKILHTLIDALNEHTQTEADESTEPERVLERWHIKKIEYFLNVPGNQLLVNGYLVNGDDSGKTTPESIGWDVPEKFKRQSAGQLLECSLETFKIMKWEDIVERFDQFSFRHFLSLFGKNKADEIAGWPDEVIDFVETVTSQTNQFALSVPEMWMQYQDFSSSDSEAAKEPWHTIQGGMDRLPHTMAHFVGLENITFGARVRSLRVDDLDEKDKFAPQKVRVIAEGYNGTISQLYDQVLLAIPPAALKMIPDRPFWSSRKDMAIRSMHFEPLYKMGLRFKTRFWEKSEPSSKGGQSTTDLPIRWIVYPSNGIDDDGPHQEKARMQICSNLTHFAEICNLAPFAYPPHIGIKLDTNLYLQ